MRTMTTLSICLLSAAAAFPAFAQGELSIEQMDGNVISKKDAGIEDTKAEEIELSPSADYQKSILSNPYADSYARMNAINSAYGKTNARGNNVELATEVRNDNSREHAILKETSNPDMEAELGSASSASSEDALLK
jgi:transcription elongation factor